MRDENPYTTPGQTVASSSKPVQWRLALCTAAWVLGTFTFSITTFVALFCEAVGVDHWFFHSIAAVVITSAILVGVSVIWAPVEWRLKIAFFIVALLLQPIQFLVVGGLLISLTDNIN